MKMERLRYQREEANKGETDKKTRDFVYSAVLNSKSQNTYTSTYSLICYMSERLTTNLSTGDNIATAVPFGIGDISTLDAITAFGPAILFLFLGQQVIPAGFETLTLLIVVFLGILGIVGLIIAPQHTSLGTFASRFWHHNRRPDEVRYRRKGTEEDVLERSLIEYDERTQDLHHVERIYPQYNVIELTDGQMVGAMEVMPANLDTENNAYIQSIIRSVKGFYDNSLDFPMVFYLTTHGLETDKLLEPYQNRESDDDVRESPILEYYVKHHQRWIEQLMGGRPTREYYILFPVTEDEVYESLGQEETISSSLSGIPIIGSMVGSATDEDEFKLSQNELKMNQISMINDRRATVRGGLIGAIGEEADSKPVTATEFAALLKEYWEGDDVSREDYDGLVGTMPVVVGDSDGDVTTETSGD